MQKKVQAAVAALLVAGLFAAPVVEAKRAGGGKSSGMSRSAQPTQSYNNNSNANTYQQPKQGSNIGGMVAAGAVGAAAGALAANAMADDKPTDSATTSQQASAEEKSGFSWFWLILIAGAAFFLFRMFKKKQQLAPSNPYAPNHSQPTQHSGQNPFTQPAGNSTNIFGQSVGNSQPQAAPNFGAYTNSGQALPDGTEPATFLRFARQRFNHIQAMNNPANIQEIQKYLTPDLYQAIYADVMENQDVAEFSNLTANVVDQAIENGQYVVSVRFSGTVSEDLNSLPQPFSEIWHFVKAQNSQQDWLVAGIQQEN